MASGPNPPAPARWWQAVSLLALLALPGCDQQEPTAPAMESPTPSEVHQVVKRVVLEVDPVSGSVTFAPVGPSSARGGLKASLVPVTDEHVLLTDVWCYGCADEVLDNQTITVHFAVNAFALHGLDFKRTAGGSRRAAMRCDNCEVRGASLQGEGPATPPATGDDRGPGDSFRVTLTVDALESRRFRIEFDLVAEEISGPIGDFTQVSTNGNDSCALQRDGSLACWGYFLRYGAPPPTGTDFVEVSTGNAFHCALRRDGSLTCWAAHDFARDPGTPTGNGFTQVSVGAYHACALRSSGSLACWGLSDFVDVVTPPGNDFVQVSAGGRHTCALRTDGSLTCWGDAEFADLNSPPGNDFAQVSAGSLHSCALRTDGSLVCWGAGTVDRDQRPDFGQSIVPTGTDFTQVSAGGFHTCAVRRDGSIACWGAGDEPRGEPSAYHFGQAIVPSYGSYSEVSAGAFHTCALRREGALVCWGNNDSGEATPPPNDDYF